MRRHATYLCSGLSSVPPRVLDSTNRRVPEMRMMLKVNMATQAANELARQGKLGSTIQSILADLKPEAAYFTDDDGERTGLIFFDLADSSAIPAVAEPWFLALNARLTFRPVMNSEDLGRALPGIEAAVKKYAART